MTMYHVFKRPDGRVTLEARDPKDSDEVLESIKAKTWDDAREKLRVHGFDKYTHRPGYGFYAE